MRFLRGSKKHIPITGTETTLLPYENSYVRVKKHIPVKGTETHICLSQYSFY